MRQDPIGFALRYALPVMIPVIILVILFVVAPYIKQERAEVRDNFSNRIERVCGPRGLDAFDASFAGAKHPTESEMRDVMQDILAACTRVSVAAHS